MIKSFYILLLSWAIYDRFGKDAWDTNLVIMYFSIFYGFILYWSYVVYNLTRDKFDRIISVILMLFMFSKIVLELSSFGLTRQEYYDRTSNEYTDLLLWAVLIILFLIALWARFIRLRRG